MEWAKRPVESIWNREETPENRNGTRAKRRGTSRIASLAGEPRTDSAECRRVAPGRGRYRGSLRELQADQCAAVDVAGADFGGVVVCRAGSIVAVCDHGGAAWAALSAGSADHASNQHGCRGACR